MVYQASKMSVASETVEMCGSPLEIYKRLGFQYGNANQLYWDDTTQSKRFKRFPGDTDLSKRPPYNPNMPGTVIYCGATGGSRVSVVDIDTLDETGAVHKEVAEKWLPLLYKTSNLIEKTPSGGIHFYYEYNDWNASSIANTKWGVDWINNCIIAAPSYYVANNQRKAYELVKAPKPTEGLTQIPQEIVEFLREINQKYPEDNPVVEAAPHKETYPPSTHNDIAKLCMCLTPEWLSQYDNWVKLLLALKGLSDDEVMMEIFLDTSARAPGYDTPRARLENERTWRRTRDNSNKYVRLTQGSLNRWARECNKELYFAIKRDSYETLIQKGLDSAYAEMFYIEIEGDILYSKANKEFYIYSSSSSLWHCEPGLVENLFQKSMDYIFNRIIGNLPFASNDEIAAKNKEIKNLIAKGYKHINSRTKNIIYDFLPARATPEKEAIMLLNNNDDLLPLANGVWVFSQNVLVPYEREHYFSHKINIAYNPDADTSDIEKAMRDWFKGNMNVINYIQYLIGYILTGYVDLKAILVIWGNAANNAKSTLWSTIVPTLLGWHGDAQTAEHYSHTMAVEDISKKAGANKDSLYNAQGKRFIWLSEPAGVKLDGEVLKRFSGDECIQAQAKYKGAIEFRPRGKLCFLCNNLPELPMDNGTINRIMTIEQNVRFAKPHEMPVGGWNDRVRPQDKGFVERLLANKEGLMKWALDGAAEFMKDKQLNTYRTIPVEIQGTSRQAVEEMDKVAQWITANLEATTETTPRITFKEIRDKWTIDRECGINFRKSGFSKEFASKLADKGFNVVEGSKGKAREYITNAKWVEEDED